MAKSSLEAERINLLIERGLGEILDQVPRALRPALLDGVADLVKEEVARERARCVHACRDRAALWQRTPVAENALAREEARARSNEAHYLADLLDQGDEEPFSEPTN